MTAEQLNACRKHKFAIQSKREEIMQLQSDMQRMTSLLSLAPRGKTVRQDTLTDQMAELLSLEKQLSVQLLAHKREVAKIEEWMERLSDSEAIIIRLRYIDGLSWDQVARKSGYSDKQVYWIRRQALKKP